MSLLACCLVATGGFPVAKGVQPQFSAHAAAADPAAVRATIDSRGVVRINGALSPPTAGTLLSHVNDALEAALVDSRDVVAMDSNVGFAERFGKVLARQDRNGGATRRHDLKLDLTPPVRVALDEVLRSIGPALSASLGDDAVLYELAALVSDPGAPQQPFHPDTRYLDEQGTAVLTAFVALQPIDATMGPTTFLPASHTAADHATFNLQDDGGEAFLKLVRSRPCVRGLLDVGDATLFSTRACSIAFY